MIEEEVIGSHTENDSQNEQQSSNDIPMDDVYKAFGIDKPEEKKEEQAEKTAPAIEQKPEPKTIKVKVDKEEREFDISEDKIPEYVQKAYALDKERDRKSELEKGLERAAKLAGFNSHEDFLANLDKLEQANIKAQEDAFETAKQKVIDDLVYSGVSEEDAREYAEKNPLVQQARAALERDQQQEQERQNKLIEQKWQSSWNELYDAFPDAKESSLLFKEGKQPEWYNTEMQSMIQQGYKPLHAYKLAHMEKIQEQSKKATQQRLIKEHHLGLRSQVETVSTQDNEPEVPTHLANAFAAFGLPASSAKKYVK